MTRSFFDGRREVTAHGYRWFLDERQLIDGAIIGCHGWEPESTKVVRQLVKPGMVVCDIGANIGWYTVIMAGLVGARGKVLSFEPMPEPRSIVEKHIDMNGLGGIVDLYSEALSDSSEMRADGFFNYSWSINGERVEQPHAPMTTGTLDALTADWERLDFLKIDVDGYEAKILRGARETLKRLRPSMLIEVCDYTLRAAAGLAPAAPGTPGHGDEVQAMLGDLNDAGYRFLWEEDMTPVASIDDPCERFDLSQRSINLVALPV